MSSEAEQAPDLAPGRDGEERAGGDEEDEHDPETGAGAAAAPAVLDARPTPGTVHVVRPLHRVGVERRKVDGADRPSRSLPLGTSPLASLAGHRQSIRPRRTHACAPYSPAMVTRERRFEPGLFGLGDGLGLVAGVVLAASSFTGWYTGEGEGEGVTISVLGWNTGVLGKLVLFVGLAVVLVLVLRELGIEPPTALPQSLLTIALGALGTVLVLVRVISIPDDFFFAGRGVGLWISLAAALGVIVGGLLQASDEL